MAVWLITGGAGFIGSHLAEALLAGGQQVRVLDDLSSGDAANLPAGVELIRGSVTDAAAVATAMAGVTGCYHLAAIASVERANADWAGVHRVNLGGTVTVFEAAAQAHARVVYASSAAVYGRATTLPVDEDQPTRPLSPYGADKLGCELHAAAGAEVHGLDAVGLRFFNVYGPRQDPRSPYAGVIARFIGRAQAGLALTVNGDGGQIRDFVHVDDAVAALLRAMATGRAGAAVANIATGRPTSILDLARTINRLAGSTLAVEHGTARPGDIRESLGTTARAEAAFGFTARVRVEDGLRRLMAAG
jgi:UDP-glucose 4-epimerase